MKKLALALLLLASPAVAQTAQNPSGADRAVAQLGSQIGTLLKQANEQQDTIAALQNQLAQAQAKIKELEAKTAAPAKKE